MLFQASCGLEPPHLRNRSFPPSRSVPGSIDLGEQQYLPLCVVEVDVIGNWGLDWGLDWGLNWGLNWGLDWYLDWNLNWGLAWDLEGGMHRQLIQEMRVRGRSNPASDGRAKTSHFE
ncbi:MAG: hypothetical protein ACE15C_12980, partial [Phycisphaerae bacterium]